MQDISKIELNDFIAKEIIRGAQETIRAMTGLTPEPGAYQVSTGFDVKGDISGIINVVQERIDGTLVVSFPKETIFYVLEKLFKKPFNEIDKPVKEAVGEFTNMIYGVIKTNLNRTGFDFKMALPTVVLGASHIVSAVKSEQTMLVPFTIEGKQFSIMLTIVKK